MKWIVSGSSIPALLCGVMVASSGAVCARAQTFNRQGRGSPPATVLFQAVPSSNASASNGWSPTRKQLTNCATGWNGTDFTPTEYPVGERYCTDAIRATAMAAGGPDQDVIAATAIGAGIAEVTNGHNAGGRDSPVMLTDTYGDTLTDGFCTSDTAYAQLGVVNGVQMPPCQTASGAVFGQATASGYPFVDVLWPTSYREPALDSALHFMRKMHFSITNLSSLHDFETDTNYNTANGHFYNGWGMHWNEIHQMWEACPQRCQGWTTMKLLPVGGGRAVTSYPLTAGHVYMLAVWGSRLDPTVCTSDSAVNCYFYDNLMIYDVTTHETPKLYRIVDTNGNRIGGIPIARPTYPAGLIGAQVQLDMVKGLTNTSVAINSDVLIFY